MAYWENLISVRGYYLILNNCFNLFIEYFHLPKYYELYSHKIKI